MRGQAVEVVEVPATLDSFLATPGWEADCDAEFAAIAAGAEAYWVAREERTQAPAPVDLPAPGESVPQPATMADLLGRQEGLPSPPVIEAPACLCGRAEPSDTNPLDPAPLDATPVDPEAAVQDVVRARRDEAMAVWRQLVAMADLLTTWSPPDHGPAGDERLPGVVDVAALAPAFVVAEVALACGISEYAAGRKLDAAMALVVERRLPRTADLLAIGAVDWPKVQALVTQTADLAADTAAAVEALVVDALPGTNVPRLNEAIRAAIAAVDSAAHLERSMRARQDRRVVTRAGADGMGEVQVWAPMEAVAAVAAELDTAVAAARAAGDRRTAGQVRCDELVARVTAGGWSSDVTPLSVAALPDACEPQDGERQASERQASDWQASALRDSERDPRSARAAVVLTMSFETWAGLTDDPARLEGYGPVAAQIARGLAAQIASTGTWRCAVVDGAHGTVLGLGRATRSPGYVPTARAADFVRTVEPVCTFPGCGVRSRRCDLDHRVPHPRGETCECNLQPLCRRHHRLKTTGLLTVAVPPDAHDPPGTTVWTTRAGRTYTHRPPPLQTLRRPPGSPPVPPWPSPAGAGEGPSPTARVPSSEPCGAGARLRDPRDRPPPSRHARTDPPVRQEHAEDPPPF